MTIVLTLPDGKLEELEVAQVEFVRFCRHHRCKEKFLTVNIDQVYCSEAHQILAAQRRERLRKVGASLTAH